MKTLNKKQLLQLSKRYGCNVNELLRLKGSPLPEVEKTLKAYRDNPSLPLMYVHQLLVIKAKVDSGEISRYVRRTRGEK